MKVTSLMYYRGRLANKLHPTAAWVALNGFGGQNAAAAGEPQAFGGEMWSMKPRTLAVFAVLGPAAFLAERQIYEAMIVPRLPSIAIVPLWWWLGEFTPPILVFLYAGWRSSSIRAAVVLSAAAFLPWLAWRALYGAITRRPVDHDLRVSDSVFWSGAAVQFAFWLFVASVGVGVRRCAKWGARRLTSLQSTSGRGESGRS